MLSRIHCMWNKNNYILAAVLWRSSNMYTVYIGIKLLIFHCRYLLHNMLCMIMIMG